MKASLFSPLEFVHDCANRLIHKKMIPLLAGSLLLGAGGSSELFGQSVPTWINPSGGDYDVTNNWHEGTLPVAGNNVFFNSGATSPYVVQFTGDVDILAPNAGRFTSDAGENVTLRLFDDDNDYQLTLFALQAIGGNFEIAGGAVTATTVVFAYGGTLKLTQGTTLTNTNAGDWFHIGSNGSSGQVIVEDGSTATIATRVYVGHSTGNSQLSVTGAGTQFTSARGIYIGASTATSGSATSGNTVTVSDGGKINTTGTGGALYLGYEAGANNNAVVVEGAGSSLAVNYFFRIGHADSSNNTLTIQDGGSVSAANLFQVGSGGGNGITVRSGGTLTQTNTGVNNTVAGFVEVDGGTISAGSWNLGAPATAGVLTLKEGTVEFSHNLVVRENARLQFDLDNEFVLDINGTITANGPIYIDILNPGILGDHTLFTYGTGSGINATNVLLGNTPDGFLGELLFLSNEVRLTVNTIPEPGAGMLLLGGLGIGLLKRKRG